MDTIVTRFAPSPTGNLHIGGARTALFNWLHARHNEGRFVLRIEDTDQTRSSKESADSILKALSWLQIDWDDGPYFQTDRSDIYWRYLEQLLDDNQAYYCCCSRRDVDAMRKKAMSAGEKPQYDGRCRNKGIKRSDETTIRFKTPSVGITVLNDVVKGGITFENREEDDFIICRSDGTPTYNFVVVVDDISMGVNTVIRGDDHVMNTPKQIMLYKALGYDLPFFGHVPMVLGQDGARLSKRHGASSITAYRDMGYLSDALLNYLARLGWSSGNDEFFTRKDLIEKFNVKNIGKSASLFDPEKLRALNAKHIRFSSKSKLASSVLPFMKERKYNVKEGKYLLNVIGTLRERSKTLVEMAEKAYFYYEDIDPSYNMKNFKKCLEPESFEILLDLLSQLRKIEKLNQEVLESVFNRIMKSKSLKFGEIAQLVRIVLTGSLVSPGIFEMMQVLGKSRVVRRLELAIECASKIK